MVIVMVNYSGWRKKGGVTGQGIINKISTRQDITHRPRIISRPARRRLIWLFVRRPTRSSRQDRSMATTWETFATESFPRPVTGDFRRRFPGAAAHLRLLVKGTHTAVAIPLRLIASPWTMTTGLRKPGPEPPGADRSAQQTSPWFITIRCALAPFWRQSSGRSPVSRRYP